ncbi:MAG: metal ABC transporter substrate-binding protein [Chloroflexi bacterium]|nr:metal ABC transporter substrate-binding protein [Chloroflexota bacterium]
MQKSFSPLGAILLFSILLSGCRTAAVTPAESSPSSLKVLAAESFLADIVQNVAGSRLQVDTLMPLGADPHAYEPTPRDVARVAEADLLFINGAGFEGWLANLITTASSKAAIIQASDGLIVRTPQPGELAGSDTGHADEVDPHFWLNPINVIRYVENIRDALGAADPAGIAEYAANADAYIAKLKELDNSLSQQVSVIPSEKRLLVTNHESFGYFADRYGFTIVGAIIPNVSTEASPSAQQMTRLVDQIRATGTKVIFLETGANSQLADQIAQETGIEIVADLYTHTLTPANGSAPNYIAMMQYDVHRIVQALLK